MKLLSNKKEKISILERINKIDNPMEELEQLDSLLNELFELKIIDSDFETLLKVFEKNPNDDGYGLFWSILHGLEHFGNYELYLLESLNRQPTTMTITMINRIKNTGVSIIKNQTIEKIFNDVINHSLSTERVKEQALAYKNS